MIQSYCIGFSMNLIKHKGRDANQYKLYITSIM